MADIVTSRVFVDGEKGITAAKLNDITASSVIQPAFYTSKPTAGTADPTDIALILKSGAYAQVPVSTLGGSATQAQIWSTRLRSFNAIGNPTFEVKQRNIGAVVTNPANGAFLEDRWALTKAASSLTVNSQSILNPGIQLPGTSFTISSHYLRITLTAQQATMAAGDVFSIGQFLEGIQLRELISDVHSISLLVRTSVANLNFGVSLRDPATTTKSLTKLCNIPAANTWTVISLPNIPVFPAGNFAISAGVAGYQLGICLASGTTFTSPANDTWQNGNFVGAVGQNNFGQTVVNSTFDIAFVQHESGAVCSTFLDKPFSQNYDEALRYFAKTYDYDVGIGTVNGVGDVGLIQQSTTSGYGSARFPKSMAKIPVCIAYNPVTGSANSTRMAGGTDYGVSAFNSLGKGGFSSITTATMPAVVAGATIRIHYTADTGW